MRRSFTVLGWMALLLIVAAPMTAAGAGGKVASREDPYVAPPSAPASITDARAVMGAIPKRGTD